MTRKIDILDTTLRDGEQSPGASMNTEEKLSVTRQLVRLNVDAIEAGFPVSSPGAFESVQRIAEAVGDSAVVVALTRAVEKGSIIVFFNRSLKINIHLALSNRFSNALNAVEVSGRRNGQSCLNCINVYAH